MINKQLFTIIALISLAVPFFSASPTLARRAYSYGGGSYQAPARVSRSRSVDKSQAHTEVAGDKTVAHAKKTNESTTDEHKLSVLNVFAPAPVEPAASAATTRHAVAAKAVRKSDEKQSPVSSAGAINHPAAAKN